MRIRVLAALFLALLFQAPGFADTVYLTNGRSFEGVIAEETGTAVKIQMPGGSLSLPRNHVLRVEKSESDFAEYLRRKTALQHGQAAAADWLKLARWAQSQDLPQGTREAALAAASLDPRLEGLAPLLRADGYVLDERLDRWVSYSDYMRRRGFVQVGGQWISHEEHAARQRAEQDEISRRNAERAAMRAARVSEVTQEAELALVEMELRERLAQSEAGVSSGYVTPWYLLPPLGFPRPCRHCGPEPRPPFMPHHQNHQIPSNGNAPFMHVPGSLIPGNLRSSFSTQR